MAKKKLVKKPAKKAAPKKTSAKKAAPKKAAAKAIVKAKSKTPKKTVKPAGKLTGMSAGKRGQLLEDLFTPLDDRLIVEKAGEATRTAGGLFIPDTVGTSDRPKQGKVVAVGRGHRDKKGRMRPLDVKLGDTVMFEAYIGSELKIDDRELVVLRESQVLGIVK